MDNENEQHLTFFESYKDQIDTWYKSNDIVREKAELYHDFLSSLLTLINKTNLGFDVISTEEDIFNHFTWCFNRVVSNFEQERIYFTSKGIFEYLWVFFYNTYYSHHKEEKIEPISEYFDILFNFNKVKTASELESFTELYKMFDKNLKKLN